MWRSRLPQKQSLYQIWRSLFSLKQPMEFVSITGLLSMWYDFLCALKFNVLCLDSIIVICFHEYIFALLHETFCISTFCAAMMSMLFDLPHMDKDNTPFIIIGLNVHLYYWTCWIWVRITLINISLHSHIPTVKGNLCP